MSTISKVTLNDGQTIPIAGFGAGTAWYGRAGVDEELVSAILTALKSGYTHLDLAEGYANEKSIGEALKRWDGKREDLWITEKILGGMTDIEGTLKKQLKELGIGYVDLYLLHGPDKVFPAGSPTEEEAWATLEKLQKEGLTKSIGVSNHRVEDIERIIKSGTVVPAVNQIELHPYILSAAGPIVEYCKKHDIKIEAYSPTAALAGMSGGPAEPVLEEIAKKLSKTGKTVTAGQVALKWAAAKGDIVVTTSAKESRMLEQLATFTTPELSAADIEAIDNAGKPWDPKRAYMHSVFE